MRKCLGLLLGLACTAFVSQAALIPQFQTSAENTPGVFTYFYTVDLDDDEQLDGNTTPTVVIYDFAGYVNGSIVIGTGAGSWTGSTVGVGPYPVGPGSLEGPDLPGVVNLVFTYSGPFVEGPIEPVFDFTVDSTFALQRVGDYQSQDSKNSQNPLDDGTKATNEGNVIVPGQPRDVPQVPEPATMSLLGGSLLGLIALRRRSVR